MNRAVVITIILILVVAFGLNMFYNIKTSQAEEGSSAGISSKLQEIIKNQQAILQKLDSMTKELHVIKIRATR